MSGERETVAAVDDNLLPAKQAWALVGFMWVAYFLNYCDRQVVSSLFPVLKTDLGFTDEQKGLTSSIFLWVYGIGCPIAGYLGDRYSKRGLVVWSLVLWSLVTAATGLSTSVFMLLTLRAAMGLSEALFMPAAVALTAAGHPAARRSRAVAAVTTAQIVGSISGSWFGGWMGDRGEWRTAFFALGVVGLVYMIPYRAFLRGLPTTEPNERKQSTSPPTAALLGIPTFAILCVVFPIFVFGIWLIYSWFPTFLGEKFSLNMEGSAFNATFYLQGAQLVGILGGGILADRFYRRTPAARFWLLAAGVGLSAPGLYAIGACETLGGVRAAAVCFGLASGLFMGNIFPAAFEVVRSESRSSAVGMLNLFGAVISGFAPWLGGLWKESLGIDGLMTATACAYVVAGLTLVGTIAATFAADHARSREA